MSALLGIAMLAVFALAIFVAIPFVLAPLVIGGMYLQRRRSQSGTALAAEEPRRANLELVREPSADAMAQAA